MKKKTILFMMLIITSRVINASEPIDSKVVYVGVNSNGEVFIQLSETIKEEKCEGSLILLRSDSAIKDKVLSLAITAFTTGKIIRIKTSGCLRSKPSMLPDSSNWGYFYIK